MLMDDTDRACKDIFEWDESKGESEPMCTDECKDSMMKIFNFGSQCCSCGNITDDKNLEDIRFAIRCNQKKRNAMRWCLIDTMRQAMKCEECGDDPGN